MQLAMSFISFIIIGVLGVFVMIHGWGLEVHSWGWIIGGYLGTATIAAMFSAA